jgi:N utilization substance protein A
VKLAHVIEELVEERGLDRATLSAIICEGIFAAYEKKFPDLKFKVEYNKKTDEIETLVEKTVVANPLDERMEISLRKARFANPDANIGDALWLPTEERIGRVEILRAKQVIAQKIRAIEASAVYNQFSGRKGELVHGVIHKIERAGILVKIDDVLAFLPKSLSIPDEKFNVGFAIRAILKDVLLEPKNDNQLILDRACPEFVERLFELEIPEVFERLVVIKKIVRIAGYKTKVAVTSNDANIDPVGTCVGVGGVRIKPILKELGLEKIDVIAWSESLEKLIADSLKPAVVNRVELIGTTQANVWVDEEQRSLAIGRMGQNIALASRLTGVEIHLAQQLKAEERAVELEFDLESTQAEHDDSGE